MKTLIDVFYLLSLRETGVFALTSLTTKQNFYYQRL